MMSATGWIRQTGRTYFGNAAAQRDYRVQLRGNRSMLLFGLYLAILIVVGFFKYGSIAGNQAMSVVQAQRELREFYTLIVTLLAGMVSIVTPGLAATTIVLERQRRSLDLIFSAPVAPRYYLVGKIIAVYRYIWMLLIISLPVTAACVVLGGASWSDVLTVYGLLSIHGLLLAAIGLMMSTVSSKPVAAVIWTYAAVAGFLSLTGAAGGAAYSMATFRSFGGASGGDVPFFIGLNPFTAIYTVGTYTEILGYHVPNYLLSSLVILLAVRLCLLGAGSLLSDGRETANLRIHWMLLAAATAFGLSCWVAMAGGIRSVSSMPPSPSRPSDPAALFLGYGLFWMLSPLVLALPTLAAYGNDGFQRQRANGSFKLRSIFDGSPAGALPYLVLIVVSTTICGMAGFLAGGEHLPGVSFWGFFIFTIGFWAIFWAIARVGSSYGVGLKTARTIVVASFVVLVILPVPFLSAISAETFNETGFSAWNLYILRPVLQFVNVNATLPTVYGLVLLGVAAGLNAWSETNRRRLGVAVA